MQDVIKKYQKWNKIYQDRNYLLRKYEFSIKYHPLVIPASFSIGQSTSKAPVLM